MWYLTKKIETSSTFILSFYSKKQQNWSQKNMHNVGDVGRIKVCDPSLNNVNFCVDWFTIYPFTWMTWFWSEVPCYSYDKKVSHENTRPMYEIFSFLKQAISVIYFPDLLIVIEWLLWNRKKGILQLGIVSRDTEIYL